jgi:putative ABC transport system substrate-binding protein
MRRRDFISLIGSAAVAWPLAARGQDHPQKLPLIGFLAGATLPSERSGMFVQGLQELGYIEGRDFHVTYRAAEGYQDRLAHLQRSWLH